MTESDHERPGGPAPGDDHLSTAHLDSNLRRRSVRGGSAMVLSQVATLVFGLAGTAVLARVLTPADFGLIAMVATLTVLINNFSDLGLTMATVQRREISDDQVSFLFWTNVGVGAAAGLLTALLAPGLAWFYGEPELTDVTLVLATAFVVSARCCTPAALTTKAVARTRVTSVSSGSP